MLRLTNAFSSPLQKIRGSSSGRELLAIGDAGMAGITEQSLPITVSPPLIDMLQ